MSRRVPSLASAAALAPLLALSLVEEGCVRRMVYRDGARTLVGYELVNPLDPRGPRDYFVRLEGQREGGVAINVLPFFVYPGPFFVEGIGGISDPDLVDESADAIACFELFEDGFFGDLAHTVDLCGRYTAGGYQAFNSENADQRFYPATHLLQFRVEYDGAKLSYSTRPVGAPAYDLVTSFDYGWSTRLLPSVGALNFHKKGVYDLLALDWGTTMPTDTTGETGVGWHLQEAYRLDHLTLGLLEGATPDFPGAATDLGLARQELSAALTLAPQILDAKVGRQVVRYLTRADRKLERAEGEVADQDADGAIGRVLDSARDQGTAFQTLFGLDFRKQF
jgi:hypothetical protein